VRAEDSGSTGEHDIFQGFGTWWVECEGNPVTMAKKINGTLIHEIGHQLDLVYDNTQANYDKKHPPHCENTDCVMYYTQKDVERGLTFCTSCKEALKKSGIERLNKI
jgi:predicted Zn-dependent protease